MGTIITVMNMKGGVGKTTVTAHLGGIFARYDILGRPRKVLLIDYDPQFNLSQVFLPSTQRRISKWKRTGRPALPFSKMTRPT